MKSSSPAALATALALAAAAPARAQPTVFGSAEVAVSGGHDTSMFLQVAPDAGTRIPAVAGWFGRVAPRLVAAVTLGAWRLEASYALDYRGADAAGHLLLQQAELGLLAPPLGRLQAGLTAAAGRFDASQFTTDRFLFASGELSLRLELGPSLRASALYRAELRRYPARPDGPETDVVHVGELRLSFRPGSRAEAALGGAYVNVIPLRASVVDDGTVRMMRGGPELELVFHRFSLGAWGWGGSLEISGQQRQAQIGGGAGALVRLGANLDATATVDWAASPWAAEALAASYARRFVALTLIAHATGRTSIGGREPRADADTDLRPLIQAPRVRFRLRAADAAAVRVIGSWNDWDAAGQPLQRAAVPDLWQGWVVLPPGVHRYRFLVDGRAARPPDAQRYVRDDFGEEDAVIEVPEGADAAGGQ